MADIFNRLSDAFGGAFSADAAKVTFVQDKVLGFGAGAGEGNQNDAVGLLVQQLTFNYQQQVTRVYEIGTNFTFYVSGRTNGTASLNRILGPRPVALAFYKKYGDVCQAATNNLDFEVSSGCSFVGGNKQQFTFALRYCVITGIGLSVTAQDMMINEQLQIMFSSLGIKGVNFNDQGLI